MNEIYRDSYNQGNEIVPDYVYDRMNIDSLNDEIGHGDLVEHRYPMLSLRTEFVDIDSINEKVLTDIKLQRNNLYSVSVKADGISVSLQIKNRKPYRLVSRGKRTAGYVLNSMFMQLIPQFINEPTDDLEFRGELLLGKADFEELNSKFFDNRYSNPRSMVSAMANADNPVQEVVDKMFIRWHGLQTKTKIMFHTQMLEHYFSSLSIIRYNICDKEDLVNCIKDTYQLAQNLLYPCDGIVIESSMTNENDGRVHLDRIALKQFDEAKYSGETEVSEIEWRLGNDGHYFPRIHFVPVEINGSIVSHAAGYCYDYLIRMGISIGSKVIVTMHGGVIPYISTVVTNGSGNLQLPADTAPIEHGDIHIWSSNSEEAVRKLRFIRGLVMLDLKDCGPALFEALYDSEVCSSLFDIARICRGHRKQGILNFLNYRGFQPGITTTNFANELYNRFTTFNHTWLTLALRIPGIGFKAANIIGLTLSGYHVAYEYSRGAGKTAIANVLNDKELCESIKNCSNRVDIAFAQGTIEYNDLMKSMNAEQKPKAILSKKPSNGMTKAKFIETYLSDYEIVDNIKDADLLICPEGETSSKIKYATEHGITIKHYNQFI